MRPGRHKMMPLGRGAHNPVVNTSIGFWYKDGPVGSGAELLKLIMPIASIISNMTIFIEGVGKAAISVSIVRQGGAENYVQDVECGKVVQLKDTIDVRRGDRIAVHLAKTIHESVGDVWISFIFRGGTSGQG